MGHIHVETSFGKLACRIIGGAGSGTVGIEEATCLCVDNVPSSRRLPPVNTHIMQIPLRDAQDAPLCSSTLEVKGGPP
jgi:hypothetical protein